MSRGKRFIGWCMETMITVVMPLGIVAFMSLFCCGGLWIGHKEDQKREQLKVENAQLKQELEECYDELILLEPP